MDFFASFFNKNSIKSKTCGCMDVIVVKQDKRYLCSEFNVKIS